MSVEEERTIAGFRRIATAFAAASLTCLLVLLAAGCGSSDEAKPISAESTCEEYLDQPSEVRHEVVARIASDAVSEIIPQSLSNIGNPDEFSWMGKRLDTACADGSSETVGELIAGGSEGGTEENRPTIDSESYDAVAGRFAATLEHGSGYTLEVSYDLGQPEAEVDIANAEPGKAILDPIVDGQLTLTNTTPERNTVLGPIYETPYINLYWKQGQLPPGGDCDDDGLELGGVVHCFLLSIRGDIDPALNADGVVELEPDGEVTIPVGLTPLGGTTVPERDAEVLSELVRAAPPSLVLLDINGLEPACDIGLTGFTAALTGDGEVLVDSESAESC